MILLNSMRHRHLRQVLADAEATEDSREWSRLLRQPDFGVCDGFLALLDHGFNSTLFSTSDAFLDSWLLGIEEWTARMTDPTKAQSRGDELLYQLWSHFSRRLSQALRRGRFGGAIPKSGGLLVFIGGLSKCLVLRYSFVSISETPTLHPIALIQNPMSAFDFWGAIDHADMGARNELKSILASGHKLIWHRNVLIHVDRRTDIGVFGPSIDTLVLAEILAQQVFESDIAPETALEIGCGNGLLSAALGNNGMTLKELFAADISLNAVVCTARNVFGTERFSGQHRRPTVTLINGSFAPDLLNRQFDLVVCNPPYIPIPNNLLTNAITADYLHAVGGTELMTQMIASAQSILRPGGRLLLMASSLSLTDALSAIPDSLTVTQPLGSDGFKVLFDVEAVFNRREWLAHLLSNCDLVSENDTYYHALHPLWIERKS